MEIQKIKKDFCKVIEYSQQIPDPQVDKLFDIWLEKKQEIIEAFGDKLIYEVKEPITFNLSPEGQQDRIRNFINMCWDMGLDVLADFLENEKSGFFDNKCENDYQEVKKGTKLVKAFKYFVEDPETLHDIQSKASQIIQENKIEGKLCFSVHPLDYLSLSETTYNWRSCHALDGEYRAGNLSYMMDSSTIVCYLKGEDNVKLPRFPEDVPWNSKKWRVLLYLSNDWKMIFAGKQYPFSTDEGMNMIVDKFFNADPDNGFRKPKTRLNLYGNKTRWSHWSDFGLTQMTLNGSIIFEFNARYIPVGSGIARLDELVKDVEGSKHYNDVLKSSCYLPHYSYLVEHGWWGKDLYTLANTNQTHFDIGGNTYCLRCGNCEVMEAGSGTMMCYDCERDYGTAVNDAFCFCEECGTRIETNICEYVGDATYCPDCFDKLCEKCEQCGDYHLRDTMIYNEENDTYLCKWCHSSW